MSYTNNPFIFTDVETPPDTLVDGIVYVCRNDARADFKCPCGCNATISLNLAEGKPQWKVIGNSITPSINRIVGCRTHFSITNGLIKLT